MYMRRRLLSILAALLPLLSACAPPAREAGGEAEIPTRGLRYVALTFDDGPRADTTGPLLDGLRDRGASATFFVIGQQIPGSEALIRRMADEGHQVGSHTYSHALLRTAGDDVILQEIRKTEALLTEILGPGDYWLRPPYGMVDRARADLIQTPMIYWSLDPEDWKVLDAAEVTRRVLDQAEDGDVILLHDFYPTSVEAALAIVDALQAEGFAFVTLAELFDVCQVEPQAGMLYAAPDRPMW